ncbi:MAG: PPOX class F420-dependent oxidoreductase [Caldilineaceae bacterium]|nr:PPOX class F420-dependent oxidoreductase [Caldilineaceae bacterium]
MKTIPSSHADIFEKRSFAHVATIDDDKPQVTPVWVEYADGYVVINSAKGRKKDRNMRDNGVVAVSVQDPDNPYRYVGVQGKVTDITEENAYDHINKLSHKYTGNDYPKNPGEVRVIYKIEPTNVWTMG